MDAHEIAPELIQAFRGMKRLHMEQHKNMRIKSSEFAVISLLERSQMGNHPQKSLKVTEISRTLAVAPSSVTPLINSLEKLGYVRRVSSEQDRRVVRIELTQSGEMLCKEISLQFYRRAQALCEYLGEQDAIKLVELIKRSSDFINQYPESNFCAEEVHQ